MQYHNTLDALTFYQTGAESEALYRQSFTLARMALESELQKALAAGTPPEHFYLVTDCDETVLDNSAYNVWLTQTGRDFHASTWSQWCQTQGAKATPGAMEFLHFADMHGVQIFYVSSRFEADREATAANLRKLDFPLVDGSADPEKSHLFLEGMMVEGAATRKMKQFEFLEKRLGPPLLRLGDNLSDHQPDRYSRLVRYDRRVANLREDAAKIGTKWIVFPNPIYGNWRESLRMKVGEAEVPARDEVIPMPYQPLPVRPPITPAEAPKMGLLNVWQG